MFPKSSTANSQNVAEANTVKSTTCPRELMYLPNAFACHLPPWSTLSSPLCFAGLCSFLFQKGLLQALLFSLWNRLSYLLCWHLLSFLLYLWQNCKVFFSLFTVFLPLPLKPGSLRVESVSHVLSTAGSRPAGIGTLASCSDYLSLLLSA